DERFHPIHCGIDLVALDGAGRIDMFGAHLRTLANEGTSPDAFVLGQELHAFPSALIASVEVVALSESDRRRADELGIETVDWTGRIAQHAVDAHAELFEFVQLLRRLQVLAF